MPRSSLQRQEFGHKKPYLVASVFSLALVIFAIGRAEMDIGKVWRAKADELQPTLARLTDQNQKLQTLLTARDQLKKQADDMKGLAEKRFYWIQVLTDLRAVMMQAEAAEKENLRTPENGGTNTDEGIWVEEFSPIMPSGFGPGTQSGGSGSPGGISPGGGMGGRYGEFRRRGGMGMAPSPSQGQAPAVIAAGGANEVGSVKLVCQGINRGATANDHLAYSVRQFLTNSPSFTGQPTLGTLRIDSDTNTFSFEMTVNFRHPFKL
jgi:hypothetical protein